MDLRLPIGGLFSVFGVILVACGLISDKSIFDKSLGINIDLWWGLVILIFGMLMGGFGLLGTKSTPSEKENL
jgi:hypothetical protein